MPWITPKHCVKIRRAIFERRNVLPMKSVIKRLGTSSGEKLTPNEMFEHVWILCDLLSMWFTKVKNKEIGYLKFDSTAGIKEVIKQLTSRHHPKRAAYTVH